MRTSVKNMESDKMRVTMIKPPIPYHLNPKEQQPLGILYVASFIRKNGYDVKIADLGAEKKHFVDKIPEADVYGITSTFLDLKSSERVAQEIKKKRKDSKIVLGGFGPTASPEYVNPDVFDSIVRGEGELAFLECLKDIENKNLKREYSQPLIENLDTLPFPARNLLDVQGGRIFNFGKQLAEGESVTLTTSRGCPFDCYFCANNEMWNNKVRYRTPENVVSEMEEIVGEFKVREIKFQDDNWTLKRDRTLELCEEIKELNNKLPKRIFWRAYTRTDLVDNKILKAMKDAGCIEIDYGIESGDQDILDIMNKKTTVEQNIEAIILAKETNLDVRGFMMVGLPGTTKYTIKRERDFLEKAKPHAINIAVFTPYPGSEMWKNPKKFGIKILYKPENYKQIDIFDKYNMHLYSNDPKRTIDSVISIDNLKQEELERIKRDIINHAKRKGIIHKVRGRLI